ncbi:hypothetical protein K7G82_23480 [Sphingomonas colocasiae]|uniref:DUF3325 domain-containing protein n=2 Tax=Sphingomonas colocasiae TaxID=1848973 RepID=A0ABS7PXB0_9SPHN|nr:hypothetical protein [Sphingomonas colocasiae]
MIALALAALVVSAIPILLLCIGDPKRRRTAGDKSGGMPMGKRRWLVAAACLPGFACAWLGDAPAFLMWLGGCALLGWALAACFGARGQPE